MIQQDGGDLRHRASVMIGRAQALAEAMGVVRRLKERISADMSDEEALRTVMLGWGEMLAWLEQAAEEAAQEAQLMRREL